MFNNLINNDALQNNSLLVIAPHQDDELLGCGGWLIKSRWSEASRSVVFFTKSSGQREKEMEAALKGLALTEIHKLDLPERWGNKKINDYFAEIQLYQIIRTNLFNRILVPSIRDKHPDHCEANRMLGRILSYSELNNYEPEVYQYEIFIPHCEPNKFLNISDVVNEKLARIAEYESQNQKYRLTEIIQALNYFRGQTMLLKDLHSVESYQTISKIAMIAYAKST